MEDSKNEMDPIRSKTPTSSPFIINKSPGIRVISPNNIRRVVQISGFDKSQFSLKRGESLRETDVYEAVMRMIIILGTRLQYIFVEYLNHEQCQRANIYNLIQFAEEPFSSIRTNESLLTNIGFVNKKFEEHDHKQFQYNFQKVVAFIHNIAFSDTADAEQYYTLYKVQEQQDKSILKQDLQYKHDNATEDKTRQIIQIMIEDLVSQGLLTDQLEALSEVIRKDEYDDKYGLFANIQAFAFNENFFNDQQKQSALAKYNNAYLQSKILIHNILNIQGQYRLFPSSHINHPTVNILMFMFLAKQQVEGNDVEKQLYINSLWRILNNKANHTNDVVSTLDLHIQKEVRALQDLFRNLYESPDKAMLIIPQIMTNLNYCLNNKRLNEFNRENDILLHFIIASLPDTTRSQLLNILKPLKDKSILYFKLYVVDYILSNRLHFMSDREIIDQVAFNNDITGDIDLLQQAVDLIKLYLDLKTSDLNPKSTQQHRNYATDDQQILKLYKAALSYKSPYLFILTQIRDAELQLIGEDRVIQIFTDMIANVSSQQAEITKLMSINHTQSEHTEIFHIICSSLRNSANYVYTTYLQNQKKFNLQHSLIADIYSQTNGSEFLKLDIGTPSEYAFTMAEFIYPISKHVSEHLATESDKTHKSGIFHKTPDFSDDRSRLDINFGQMANTVLPLNLSNLSDPVEMIDTSSKPKQNPSIGPQMGYEYKHPYIQKSNENRGIYFKDSSSDRSAKSLVQKPRKLSDDYIEMIDTSSKPKPNPKRVYEYKESEKVRASTQIDERNPEQSIPKINQMTPRLLKSNISTGDDAFKQVDKGQFERMLQTERNKESAKQILLQLDKTISDIEKKSSDKPVSSESDLIKLEMLRDQLEQTIPMIPENEVIVNQSLNAIQLATDMIEYHTKQFSKSAPISSRSSSEHAQGEYVRVFIAQDPETIETANELNQIISEDLDYIRQDISDIDIESLYAIKQFIAGAIDSENDYLEQGLKVDIQALQRILDEINELQKRAGRALQYSQYNLSPKFKQADNQPTKRLSKVRLQKPLKKQEKTYFSHEDKQTIKNINEEVKKMIESLDQITKKAFEVKEVKLPASIYNALARHIGMDQEGDKERIKKQNERQAMYLKQALKQYNDTVEMLQNIKTEQAPNEAAAIDRYLEHIQANHKRIADSQLGPENHRALNLYKKMYMKQDKIDQISEHSSDEYFKNRFIYYSK